MSYKRIALVTLLAVFGYVNPAHAITASLSAGTNINPSTGTADGGTFTTQPYTNTTTFNSVTPTTTTSSCGNKCTTTNYTFNATFNDPSAPTLTYSWSNQSTATGTLTGIKSNDNYAPPNPNGQKINQTQAPSNNKSAYPAVWASSPITITSTKLLNYVGINWGYADQYNQIAFYNTNVSANPIATFTSTDFFGSPLPNPEGSTYADFVSSNNNEFFNKIVLTDTGTTGFETDNYAVRVAPAPSQLSGIVALALMGGWSLFNHNRKLKQKQLVIK